jgi:hypothetical protein
MVISKRHYLTIPCSLGHSISGQFSIGALRLARAELRAVVPPALHSRTPILSHHVNFALSLLAKLRS